jgi:hypothetical protein
MNDDREPVRVSVNAISARGNLHDNPPKSLNKGDFLSYRFVNNFSIGLDELRVGKHELIDDDKTPAFNGDPFSLITAIEAGPSAEASIPAVMTPSMVPTPLSVPLSRFAGWASPFVKSLFHMITAAP